jgi:hypothetical protein
MTDERNAVEQEREMREHEAEAREHDAEERSDKGTGSGDGSAATPPAPGNVQEGTTTGS